MKAFRIISVALMAVLMAAGFIACSKMENEEPQKRLAKITMNEGSSVLLTYNFKYDDKGLLKNATLEIGFNSGTSPITQIESYDYVWNGHSIDVTATSSINGTVEEQYEYTYRLSDEGLISSKNYSNSTGHSFSFGYDSSNRLTRYDDLMISWDNDKLTSIETDNEEYWYHKLFTFGTNPAAKGHSPLVTFSVTGEALILTHPELAGLKTSQIPLTEVTLPNELNMLKNFEYELDEDGYISKIEEITTQPGTEPWSFVYTIVWE